MTALLSAMAFWAPPPASGPGAAPLYDSAGTLLSTGTLIGAKNIALPTTLAAGNYVLIAVAARNNDQNSTCTTPSGFTAFAGNPFEAGTGTERLFLFERIIESAAEGGTNVSVTIGGTEGAGSTLLARSWRWTAADGFGEIGVSLRESISTRNDYTGASLTPGPTVTPTGINRLGVSIVAASANADITTMSEWASATGGTWTQRTFNNIVSGGDQALEIMTADLSAGSPISGGAIAISADASNAVGVAFALRPAEV